jgi:hypothetical protein
MTLVEAAQAILKAAGGKELSAQEITQKAIAEKLISPKSQKPWVHLQAAIRETNARLEAAGKSAQFVAINEKWQLAKN